jgi:CDP-glucose 4,6-dehydratase
MQIGRSGNNLFKKKLHFWKNKKVIITGCTGFKGAWLTIILKRYGAKVVGIALSPKKNNDIFNKANLKGKIKYYNCNINNSKRINVIFSTIKPDIVFHFAAQSLVLDGYKRTEETYLTNIIGSANIIEACLKLKKKNSLLITTTDKVYKNDNSIRKFIETDELSGNDPYSASKASLEVLCKYYLSLVKIHKYFSMSIARAGNVIGGGDWSDHRLFPDIFRSIYKKRKIGYLIITLIFFASFLFVNVTARNDWFSTLSPENRSILLAAFVLVYMILFGHGLPGSINKNLF